MSATAIEDEADVSLNGTAVEDTQVRNAGITVNGMKQDGDDDDDEEGLVDYKNKYRTLKRKLKCLLYEQECFHEELRKIQRKCLRVNRDKSFLLDHLLKYEEPDSTSEDEEMTDTSGNDDDDEDEIEEAKPVKKVIKKKSSNKLKKSKSSAKDNGASIKNTLDKVKCKNVENGKQCSKLVSFRVKSGLCYSHRLQQQSVDEKAAESTPNLSADEQAIKSSSSKAPKQPGGKDISQIREALEASMSHDESNPLDGDEIEEDDLVIDVPK